MTSFLTQQSFQHRAQFQKHCQRHNGPEGWVLLTKETSSYTNLDQIPKFKIFRPNFNIKILTKHSLHNLTKPQQQNTDQTSVSKVSLELQLQTLGQTLCSKSEQNLASWPNFSTWCFWTPSIWHKFFGYKVTNSCHSGGVLNEMERSKCQ